ncbi:MAG TPA: hypothetical protein VFQ35_11405, partial [Polyangiaceae bacterium]|nr:hypothetical protein [Polyangiaceae bacterium]
MRRFLRAVPLLACIACSGGSADPANTPTGGATSAGGQGGLTGGSGGVSGATAMGGVGVGGGAAGAGAQCSNASVDPGAVAVGASLPARFVLVTDPALDDASAIASWTDFTADCGSGAVGPLNQKGFAPWGECVARHYVERVNETFASLLQTKSPLL